MALSRRTGQKFQASIWPGFVDAMTALLLVLMFVLTIFMVVQFVLSETISDQETELDGLSAQIVDLADALGLEQTRSRSLETDVARLDSHLEMTQNKVESQLALIASLTAKNTAQTDQLTRQSSAISSFEAQVASLLSQRDTALGQVQQLNQEIANRDAERRKMLSDQQALQLALASVRDEVDLQTQQARLAAARHDALKALIADLRNRSATADKNLSAALVRLEGTDAQTKKLQSELAAATQNLSEAEKNRLLEQAAAEALRERLKNSDTALTAMTLALEAKRKQAEDTLTLLAAAKLAKANLDEKLATALAAKLTAQQAAKEQLTAAEQRAVLLATAQAQLAEVEAKSADEQRKLKLLNQQVAALRGQLGSLQELLDESAAKDVAANIQLQSLGSQLNTALARVAAEEKRRRKLEEAERKRIEATAKDLERYKSDFFGQLREVLGAEEGVRIEGDRFVFSSEVLFASGSVDLLPEGKTQIARIADILRRVSNNIPPEIDWVIRVDGHTDNVPLSGFGRYRDNWELSQGRALSVVRFMFQDLGIAPSRLAANGFGEYRPINPANTPEARAQNRRIELKLTER